MKKFLSFMSPMAALLLMAACTAENDIAIQTQPEKPETVNGIIPMSYARQRLATIVGEINAQIPDEANRIPDNAKAITSGIALKADKTPLTRADNASDARYYVFRFDNDKAFAIMSASPDDPELLAIGAGTPNFADPNAQLPDSNYWRIPSDGMISATDSTISKPDINDDGLYRVKLSPTYKTLHEGGRITVKWGNDVPFNDSLQIRSKYKDSVLYTGKAAAGCVAVAVAQLMTAKKLQGGHYKDHNFNWELLSLHRTAKDILTNLNVRIQVATLMKDLGLPENLANDYRLWVSYAYDSNIPRTLRNFGYDCPEYSIPFDLAKAWEELDAGYPVLMNGQGKNNKGEIEGYHEWLLHGMMEAITPVNCYNSEEDYLSGKAPVKTETKTTLYLQYNWGWDGGSDGYYIFNKPANCYTGPHYPEANSIDSIAPWCIYMPKSLTMRYGYRLKNN